MMSLQNYFLVAMPSLNDSVFERSIIYICEHNEKGAMGIMLNVPLDLDVCQLLTQMKMENASFSLSGKSVFSGGPVSTDRGFVLHTPMDGFHASLSLTDELMMTTSLDILSTLGTSAEPKQYMIALGYAGWEKGQLEEEIRENTWLTVPASPDIIFDIPYEDRWLAASKSLGIDIWQLSPQAGHA
ncbi:MAG: YqgE/AlgH family protein [Tolumonas sp.]|jgi:putative transcriptional regulator|nr:MAG: YqgE/AlgH family protein [Tolumonas sp.]